MSEKNKKKYYAAYDIDGWDITLSDKDPCLNYVQFDTLAEAKQYIREGIECDRNDLKLDLMRLNKFKINKT